MNFNQNKFKFGALCPGLLCLAQYTAIEFGIHLDLTNSINEGKVMNKENFQTVQPRLGQPDGQAAAQKDKLSHTETSEKVSPEKNKTIESEAPGLSEEQAP